MPIVVPGHTRTLSHSLSLSHTPTLSLSHSHTLPRSLTDSLRLFHTFAHFFTLFHTCSLSLTHSLPWPIWFKPYWPKVVAGGSPRWVFAGAGSPEKVVSARVGCDGVKGSVAASVSSVVKTPEDVNGCALFPRPFLRRADFGFQRAQEADALDGNGLFHRPFLHLRILALI